MLAKATLRGGYLWVLPGMLAVLVSGYQALPAQQKPVEIQRLGVLAIPQQSACVGEKAGCTRHYKLYQQDMRHWIDLTGQIDRRLEHYLVKVTGRWVDPGHRLLQVTAAEPWSAMPYHRFLVAAADRYTASQFPCRLAWDKSFRWKIEQGQPQFMVRLTRDPGAQNSPRLVLRYDARTQRLLGADQVNWVLPWCAKKAG